MVQVFSKPNCVQCKMTKSLLDNLGVPYQDIDVTKDETVLARLVKEGKRALPVVETTEDFWMGFNPSKIKALA